MGKRRGGYRTSRVKDDCVDIVVWKQKRIKDCVTWTTGYLVLFNCFGSYFIKTLPAKIVGHEDKGKERGGDYAIIKIFYEMGPQYEIPLEL